MQIGDLIPRGSRVIVFDRIYWVFLALGTLVGVVVISYALWKAYKYRERDGVEDEYDRPQLGEVPQGGGGGRKLFLSFSLSAIIVISLIVWTYGTLLYVETAPAQQTDALEVEVVGFQFGWEFHYPNGYVATSTAGDPLRVPADRMVTLSVTSSDVFHNFGISELRVKSDAIPGQTTDTWFRADEPGEYTARCYELCGAGHSFMTADVVVMEQEAFDEWYANTSAEEGS
ncbi:MAG TPA: cytochrome c oxidase subunit II [Halobacteriales archaeon]|nr:cytochrome c oxidase subunit II [Halobacteriales archaeon]